MTRLSSDEGMEALETAVSKELQGLLERGAFDSIGRLLYKEIASCDPAPSRALQLSFGLKLLDIRADGKSKKRVRALGHLFVVTDKVEGAAQPKIRFGISPAFVDDVKPCPTCVGTGVEPDDAKMARQGSPRPFATTYRDLNRD